MVKAAPASTLVVPQPDLLLELLIVPLNAPAQLGPVHKLGQCRVRRQGRQSVFRRLPLSFRPLDQEPLLGSGLMPQVIAMGRADPHGGKA